jgi:tRNA pseudouridine38-40 synthase
VRTFRLLVSYDGTAFHGWQVQPGLRTVQGVMEESLERVLDQGGVRIHGAGRTDAGVHARGQVASFSAETSLPARAIAPRLARELPADIAVRSASEAPPEFHARHSALARRYSYRLLQEDDLLLSRFAWRPRCPVKPEALAGATAALGGEHDFAAFESSGSPAITRCRVTQARWQPWEGGVQFDIVADHFLYHMVRGIVGTALDLSDAPDPAAAMRAVLASRDRRQAGRNAPPQGLCLEQVVYDEGGVA